MESFRANAITILILIPLAIGILYGSLRPRIIPTFTAPPHSLPGHTSEPRQIFTNEVNIKRVLPQKPKPRKVLDVKDRAQFPSDSNAAINFQVRVNASTAPPIEPEPTPVSTRISITTIQFIPLGGGPMRMTPPANAIHSVNSFVLWLWRDDLVERSIDGGNSWSSIQLIGMRGVIVDGSSPNPLVCWLVGTAGTIYLTRDGANWRKVAPPAEGPSILAVEAKNRNKAIVTTADGRRFQTTNAGMTWKLLN